MTDGFFDAPLFIKEKREASVEIARTPFFYNDNGTPTYVDRLPAGVTALIAARSDPAVAMGTEHVVAGTVNVKQNPPYGVETQLGFVGQDIRYQPLWATREVAAAFGITLVEQGQGIKVDSPAEMLSQVEYEYGVFAGHQSPYQGTGNTLLSVVCTDLEHHDFPHVFASIDPEFPLVISVGRYWPKRGRICLADLWVPRGAALYIPPKPALFGSECIDLHNNRNSARACWGQIERNSIETHTLLQTSDTYTYWYWNPAETVHTNLT